MRAKEEKEEARARARLSRESLHQMILDDQRLTVDSKWCDAQALLKENAVYLAVEERERQDIFRDVIEAKVKVKKEELKISKKRQHDAFLILLNQLPGFSIETTWREAFEKVQRMPEFLTHSDLKNVDPVECLIAFEERMKIWEDLAEENRRVDREQLRATQRRSRESFLELLEELEQSNVLHGESTWASLKGAVMQDVRYGKMLGQPGSTPLDLFKLRVEVMRERLSLDKRVVRDVFKVHSLKFVIILYFLNLSEWNMS